MKNSAKKILKKTLPFAIGLLIIWISVHDLNKADIESVKNSFQTANYWWVAVSLLLGIISHFSRAYRWQFTLEPLGYKPKFWNSFMAVLIAYLVNLGIPRAGELSRAATLTEYENIPLEKGFGTIVAERVADVIMLLLFMIWATFAQYDLIIGLIQSKIPKNPILLIAIGGLLVVLAGLFLRWIKKSEKPIFIKIREFINGLIMGVKSILTMKKKWAYLFHTFFIWTLYLLMLYTAAFAIPETAHISLNAILISFVMGSMSYAATTGGIGSYPFAVQQALLLYGVSGVAGLSFGWIMWTSQTVMILVFGGLSFLFLPIYNKEKTES